MVDTDARLKADWKPAVTTLQGGRKRLIGDDKLGTPSCEETGNGPDSVTRGRTRNVKSGFGAATSGVCKTGSWLQMVATLWGARSDWDVVEVFAGGDAAGTEVSTREAMLVVFFRAISSSNCTDKHITRRASEFLSTFLVETNCIVILAVGHK